MGAVTRWIQSPFPKYKVSIVIGIIAYKFIAIRGGSAMRMSSFRRGDIV